MNSPSVLLESDNESSKYDIILLESPNNSEQINLDELSIYNYDIKYNNINKFIYIIKWKIYTYFLQLTECCAIILKLKTGDIYITIPIIIIILGFSIYYVNLNDGTKTGIMAEICFFICILLTMKKINILPYDKVLYYHKIFSILLFFISILHGIACLKKKNIDRDNLKYKFYTGYAFILSIIFIIFISMSSIKESQYHIFFNSHVILFIIIFICSMLHGNGFTMYLMIIFLLDLLYRIFLSFRINKLKLSTHFELITNNIIKLEIDDTSLECHSGQYIFLCIPQISLFEWHPYSIANSITENKTFYIKIVGDWTNKIKQNIQQNIKMDILIDGFYGDISKYIFEYRYILLFSGGVGITPIFSTIKDMYINHINNIHKIKKIYLICTFDEYNKIIGLFEPIYDKYQELFDKRNINIDSIFNTFIHITKDSYNTDPDIINICNNKYFITNKRPDIYKYITDFNSLLKKTNIKRIGVFVSGPMPMVNEVYKYTNLLSKTQKIKYDIYTENYQY